jgi:hypothetical protein
VTLVGDGAAPAALESPRQYFRRHLQRQTSAAADLTWYLDRSVPQFAGSAEVRLAVEEIVDRLGEFLGFSTTRGEQDDHGVWRSAGGHVLLVRVLDAAGLVAAIGAGLHARDRALASPGVERADAVSCLLVVCGQADERRVNEAVALRRASLHARIIGIGALTDLAGRAEAAQLGHEQIVTLLRPASALADAMMGVLAGPAPRPGHGR